MAVSCLVAPGSIHFASVFLRWISFRKAAKKAREVQHAALHVPGGLYVSILGRSGEESANRIETVGRQACEAVGGKIVGAWYCFGDFDFILIADVPNNESMTAISLAVAAGGAIKSSRTTPLMTGAQAVEAMKKVADVAKVYRPAK